MNPVLKAVLYIAGVAAMTCGNSIGALFFKVTMVRVKVFSIKNTFKIPTLYFGILCYAVGSLLNILLMYFLDYSTVYPLTSLTCVWTLLFSSVFLVHPTNNINIANMIIFFFIIYLLPII